MITIVPKSSESLGNTIPNSPRITKQSNPAKKWVFTLHKYSSADISAVKQVLETQCDMYIFSEELGESGITPHLQGYFEFKVKQRPKGLFPLTTHFELAKGTRQQNIVYCSKEGLTLWKKGCPRVVPLINPDRQWEKDIIEIIKTEADDRHIYWFWGSGGIGKTSFCKYLTMTYGAICLGGKGSDMRNGIKDYCDKKNDWPEIVLINLPKSFNCDYVSYEGIENVKDMYFYSGKYEGGMICGCNPHLIIFANEKPDFAKLNSDRWIVTKIH